MANTTQRPSSKPKVNDFDEQSQQIEQSIEGLEILDKINPSYSILSDIRQMAGLPNGGQRAAYYLLVLANKFITYLLGERVYGGLPEEDHKLCSSMDGLLQHTLKANWSDIVEVVDPREGKDWQLPLINLEIKALRSKLDDHGITHRHADGRCVMHFYFKESEKLVHLLGLRRESNKSVLEAVGHKLPPELVMMIVEKASEGDKLALYLKGRKR
ncbi:hypothetical protein LTR56_019466 [Elasticomyces elasticus]|nr:hypothetical protein LTR56_019466 [Elasticomyces elasticus]KAK3634760.1 hypothetical protein LTR22_019521 [Elasticomyces elasticus]KAK4924854.1 hypothetical protein LTR49_008075 [Elasticomyces elasticus]KAK5750833.1 hypothetical protein LTS12_019121 [Elasticomyces elasticus]